MLSTIVWGLLQGLTEFLPVSSSGHLVIVPAYLSKFGVEVAPPSLAVSAVLHLGTLVAVLIYFHDDIARMLPWRRDPDGRRILVLLAVGSVPVLAGLPLSEALDDFQATVSNVGWALVATGVVLAIGQRVGTGSRQVADGRISDALVIGVAQAVALIPGISRSGMTISAGNARRFEPAEAARFSFLLGIPAIAAGGLSQLFNLAETGAVGFDLLVGFVVAGVSGYLTIRWFLTAIRRVGLTPFAVYCLAVGIITVIVF